MVYGSVARGYKPGGANGSNGQFLIPATFQPETNTAFEIGSKNLFLDNTLRLNASVFYYMHDNYQYIETDPIPFDSGISNIPRVEDYGAEFEGNYTSPDGRLHIDGNLALERGRVASDYRTLNSTIANRLEGVNFSGSNEIDFTTFTPTGPCAFFGAFGNPACLDAGSGRGQQHQRQPAAGHAERRRLARRLLPVRQRVRRVHAARAGGLSRQRVGADLQRSVPRQGAGLHGGEPQPRLRADQQRRTCACR